jgi:hypothetical protein
LPLQRNDRNDSAGKPALTPLLIFRPLATIWLWLLRRGGQSSSLTAERALTTLMLTYRFGWKPGLDAALDLQATGDGLVVIIEPTACFHVRLGFHSYLLLLVMA